MSDLLGLDVIGGEVPGSRVESGPDTPADLVSPVRIDLFKTAHGLGPQDHQGRLCGLFQMRDVNLPDLGDQGAQVADRFLDTCLDLGFDVFKVERIRHTDPEVLGRVGQPCDIVGDRCFDRAWVLWIVTGHDGQRDGRVGHTSGHRARMVQGPRQGVNAVFADPSECGLETDRPAQCRWDPDRASGIGSKTQGRTQGGHRGSRSATRSPGYTLHIPRVSHVSIVLVEIGHTIGKLVHVSFSKEDRAGVV